MVFPILRRRRTGDLGIAAEEMSAEIFDGPVGYEHEVAGRGSVRKSKEQANRTYLFFGWNRVDKTH